MCPSSQTLYLALTVACLEVLWSEMQSFTMFHLSIVQWRTLDKLIPCLPNDVLDSSERTVVPFPCRNDRTPLEYEYIRYTIFHAE